MRLRLILVLDSEKMLGAVWMIPNLTDLHILPLWLWFLIMITVLLICFKVHFIYHSIAHFLLCFLGVESMLCWHYQAPLFLETEVQPCVAQVFTALTFKGHFFLQHRMRRKTYFGLNSFLNCCLSFPVIFIPCCHSHTLHQLSLPRYLAGTEHSFPASLLPHYPLKLNPMRPSFGFVACYPSHLEAHG